MRHASLGRGTQSVPIPGRGAARTPQPHRQRHRQEISIRSILILHTGAQHKVDANFCMRAPMHADARAAKLHEHIDLRPGRASL